MTAPDPQDLRRLLAELADGAPTGVDRAAVARHASRRRLEVLTATASALVLLSATVAVALQAASPTDRLGPAPVLAPSTERSTPPVTFYAADGSRIGSYRTSDGTRTDWLSPVREGFGAGELALWDQAVLFGSGNGKTRGVYAVDRVPRPGNGPGALGEAGGFDPAVLPDGSRHAFLVTGNDAAYTPPDPNDLRLVLTQERGGVQGVAVRASDTVDGLAFAGPDRLVLAVSGARPDVMGLRVYDFQTDQAELGTRAPDEQHLPAPPGCSWSKPTATAVDDHVLVLQRCEDRGAFDAVVVDVTAGVAVRTFGAVLGDGPGQVDSLDLDRTGNHLIAQVHTGALPPATGSGTDGSAPSTLRTRELPGGQTITTTSSVVSPVWD